MAVPLKAGPNQFPVGLFGHGPGEDAGAPIWKCHTLSPEPNEILALKTACEAYGIVAQINLAGARTAWCDKVNNMFHFNRTKYNTRIKRFKVASASNPGGCSQAIADAVAAAFASKIFVCYVMDEANHPDFDGTITLGTVNDLCLYTKSLWPGVLTFVRMTCQNLSPEPAGGWTGLDYCGAWYTNVRSSQTALQFFNDQCSRAALFNSPFGVWPGFNWMNSPYDEVWDHDADALTADKRVCGDGAHPPFDAGQVLAAGQTTNRTWLIPPADIRVVEDALVASTGYLDYPGFNIWQYPYEAYRNRDVWWPYWTRSDFITRFNHMLDTFNTRASWTGWRTPKGETPPPPPPPATGAQYAYAEVTARQTSTATAYTDIPGATIPSTSLTAGHKYAIFVSATLDISGVSDGNMYCRLLHGATAFSHSENATLPYSANHKHPYGFFTVWTAVASEALKLQFHAKAASGKTIGADNISIFALDLDSLPANSYFTAQNAVSQALGAGYSDGASVTFTPAASDWAIFSCAQIDTPSISQSVKSRINSAGTAAATDPEMKLEGRDAVNDRLLLMSARAVTLTAVANTFKEQAANTGGGGPRLFSEILALKLDAFGAHGFNYNNATLNYGDGSNFVTQALSASITPTADGPIWAFCSHGFVPSLTDGKRCRMRLQIDNADTPDTQTTDAYECQAGESTDVFPMTRHAVKTVTAGTRTVDMDASINVAINGRGGSGRCVLAVQLSATAGGANLPPVWNVIPSVVVDEGETIDFTVLAVDPESDTLTYSVVGSLPSGAQFNASARQFVWTPDTTQAGSYTITLRVSDTHSTVDATFNVTVVDVPTVLDYRDLRSLRYDHSLQGGRVDITVSFNGAGNADKQQGITGIEVELIDLGRI